MIYILHYISYNHYLYIFFKANKLLISSTGAAKEVLDECLGTYRLTEQISNNRSVYEHMYKDRYLHFSPGGTGNWMVNKNDKINMTYPIQPFELDVILNN